MSARNKLPMKRLNKVLKRIHQQLLKETEAQGHNPFVTHRGTIGPNLLNTIKQDILTEYKTLKNEQDTIQWFKVTLESLERMVQKQ